MIGLLFGGWRPRRETLPEIEVTFERCARKLTDADLAQLARIEINSCRPALPRDHLAKLLMDPTTTLYFARAMDIRVGYALVRELGAWTQILRVVVHRGSQRRGLGRGLVRTIQRDVRPEHPKLMTIVHELQLSACKFFAACGFDSRYRAVPPGVPREWILFTARDVEASECDGKGGATSEAAR